MPQGKLLIINSGRLHEFHIRDSNGCIAENHGPVYSFTTIRNGLDIWYNQSKVPHALFYDCKGQGKKYFSSMRFMLATAMYSDAYFSFSEENLHHYDNYYDEYDLDLGFPTGPMQQLTATGENGKGVWVRFFNKGAVILNMDNQQTTVTNAQISTLRYYDGPYYRFKGGQDPSFNNGQIFDEVTLQGKIHKSYLYIGDAIFLVKQPTTAVAEIIIDSDDEGTSAGSYPAEFFGSWQQTNDNVEKAWCLSYRSYKDAFALAYSPPGDGDNSAIFKPTIGIEGDYAVYEWHGDKTDVKWQKRHALPVIVSIDEKGRMNDNAGPLKGLPVAEARKKIVELLEKEGLLIKVEETVSSIGTCWRCHTPVEIIPKKQWFVKTRELAEKVLEEAEKIKWVPEHAKKILENWVKSLDWDWVISRQRYFGTPFPVYYCSKCGYTIVVEPKHLPIDPRKDPCPVDKCPRCGSREFVGEKDVMDTWMDSSITAAVHAGWPDKLDDSLFPADLQPNGFDIIRTWDYYLLVRGIALFGKTQYKTALINGMMRGTDGRMMHKSYGNYVSLLEVIEKYGADAFRIWVASAAATGSDLKFSWQGLDYAKRFLTKIWNATRLAYLFIKDYKPSKKMSPEDLKEVDNWILREFAQTVREVEESLENFDFQSAIVKLIDFTWHKFCDHYLELIKYRVVSSEAAKYTLYTIILDLLKMLSVFAPHISEELYYRLYEGKEPWISITVAPWPKPPEYSEEKARIGDIAVAVTAELRRLKHDKRIPLSKEVDSATINPGKYRRETELCLEDIKNTLHIKKIVLDNKFTEGRRVENYPEIIVGL